MPRHRRSIRTAPRSNSNLGASVARQAASARVLEILESRQLLTSTPWALTSANPLLQNWETTNFTTAGDWSVVPSIEGFAIGAPSSTNVNPGTLTAATPGTLNINPFTTQNPDSNTTAGNTEFEFTSGTAITGTRGDSSTTTTGLRTVAFQGSGNASSGTPFIKAYINSTGLSGSQLVRVSYDLIDIDAGTVGSPTSAAQQVALQYRTDSTSIWTNVPDGYVPAAGPNNATKGTATLVNATLPSDAVNKAGLEIRIITTDAGGNDQFIAIENINISAVAVNSPGTLALTNTTLSTPEAISPYNIVINRTGGSTGAATVDFTLAAGSASAPADFTTQSGLLTGTVTFADGVTTANIPVTIVNDTATEPTETFTVTLTNATGATLGAPATATISIIDDDVAGNPGTFNFSPATATVGESDGNVVLNVTRTGGSFGAVTLNYATTAGTASDGSDYTGTQTGTVSFVDGALTGTITIPIIGDGTPESLETFTVTLSNPTAGTIGASNVATVTINDDDVVGDPGTVTLTAAIASVNESAGTVTLQLNRTGGTAGAIIVDYATTDGAAVSPGDYAGTQTGQVTFANGIDTAQIVINIVSESTPEANEDFTVTLTNASGGASLGDITATQVYIVDDDVAIPSGLRINEVSVDPPGTNTPKQFVEIKGPANASLDNIFVMQLEGDSEQGPGSVDFVLDLTGKTLGSNGLLLITAATNGWTPIDPATNVATTSLLDTTTFGFEVASYSFALMFRNPFAIAAPAVGADLDTDNAKDASGKGTLEGLLPASLTMLDGVGGTDGGALDVRYGTVLPQLTAGGAPDGIVRISDALNDPLAFYYGINAGGTVNTTLTFTATANQRSTNFPVNGALTPGAVNAGVVGDTDPPTVVSTSFDPRNGQKVVVTFSEDVGASIAATDFSLVLNSPSPVTVSLVVGSISPDGKTVTLTFNQTGGLTQSILQDGNYTFTTKAGQVADAAGNVLASDNAATIKFINGDFNFSNNVDFNDLVPLAQNYNLQSGATYAMGDANYDGKVDFNDLVVLAQHYGQIGSLMAMIAGINTTPAAPTLGTKNRIPVDTTGGGEAIVTAAAAPTAKGAIGTKATIR